MKAASNMIMRNSYFRSDLYASSERAPVPRRPSKGTVVVYASSSGSKSGSARGRAVPSHRYDGNSKRDIAKPDRLDVKSTITAQKVLNNGVTRTKVGFDDMAYRCAQRSQRMSSRHGMRTNP